MPNRRALLLAACLAATGAEALAGPPALLLPPQSLAPASLFWRSAPVWLPSRAFAELPPCALDPFSDADASQQVQRFDQHCGQDKLSVKADAQRVREVDTGPSRYALDVDQLVTRKEEALTTSARLGWSGQTDEQRRRAARAMVAAGAQLQMDEDWSVDVNVGRERTAGLRTRATVSGAWRPVGENLLFLQLAAEPAGIAQVAGFRWWLVPGRVTLELTARMPPDGQTVEPRVNVSVLDWNR